MMNDELKMMNDECGSQLKVFLFSIILLTFSNPAAGSAQEATTLPCDAVEATPVYLHYFMNWGFAKQRPNSVEIIYPANEDSVLAAIIFNDFNLQKNYSLLNLKGDEYLTGIINGRIKIVGSCRAPMFRGRVSIAGGHIKLTNFGRQAFENIAIDTSAAAFYFNRFDSLQINVNIKIGEDFYLRNKQHLALKIRLTGRLNVQKEIQETLKLTGTVKGTGGYIKPLGTKFKVLNAKFTYTGSIDNPKITLTAIFEPRRANQDVKIKYHIGGTLEEPVFKFQSRPPMELKNIFSYVLFRQPFYRLGSVEQGLVSTIATRSVINQTTDVLLNKMQTIATQKLSVDVVRIDNTTAESGTVVTTGWYISPKVFFAIQNVIASNPKIGFYLEYYLTENLKLILSQDNDYGQGIDLEWEYDY